MKTMFAALLGLAALQLVNREIFVINADGSGTASLITDTNGTSVEGMPKWGW